MESEEAQPSPHFAYLALHQHLSSLSSLSSLEPEAVLHFHCYSDPVREREHEPFVFGVSDSCGSQPRVGIDQLAPKGAGGKDGGGEKRDVGGWAEGQKGGGHMKGGAYPGGARSAEDICEIDTGEAQITVCVCVEVCVHAVT